MARFRGLVGRSVTLTPTRWHRRRQGPDRLHADSPHANDLHANEVYGTQNATLRPAGRAASPLVISQKSVPLGKAWSRPFPRNFRQNFGGLLGLPWQAWLAVCGRAGLLLAKT